MTSKNDNRQDDVQYTVVTKSSEPEGVWIPYFEGEDEIERARR